MEFWKGSVMILNMTKNMQNSLQSLSNSPPPQILFPLFFLYFPLFVRGGNFILAYY